jgi:hypothetical protein
VLELGQRPQLQPVRLAALELGVDDQDVPRDPGVQVQLRELQRAQPAGAGVEDVERRRVREAQQVLEHGAGGGFHEPAADARVQHEVDVAGVEPGRLDRALPGAQREVHAVSPSARWYRTVVPVAANSTSIIRCSVSRSAGDRCAALAGAHARRSPRRW